MKRMFRIGVLLVALALPNNAVAQDYPNRAVTIVAPAAPGGLYSLFARIIGNKLEQRFGKPFIVENRPGASAIVGSMSVIRAPHDGYTLMVANNTGMAVNVTLRKELPYDPVNDFVPVALIVRIPEVLVVNAALPVHSVADIAKLGKATPGGLTYGSAGAGTAQHFSGVLLASALGIPMTHVPYKGMQPAINDVAGGHLPLMFSPIPFALPLAQAGKLRMLGVTTTERLEAIPDVPPLTEIGVKDFDAVSWFMLVAGARTPPEIVDLLHREVRTITGDPEVRAAFVRFGLVPVASPPPGELKAFVRSEIVRWGEIVKKAGLQGTE
ncbi:MAG: tripartite tricarboxylate transporter substrate binding protein [Pseudomonadota bacterium]